MVKQRFPSPKAGRSERRSVYLTNLAVLALAAWLCLLMGWKTYLFIQLAIMLPAGVAGVWLFYVQHQFEGVYWERREKWDYLTAALQGSSFYKLPKVLQWFSGNIGFHHIHHLSPRIPNYNLEKCHRAEPLFQTVKPIGFWSSFRSLSFRLWDERRRRLVGYWVLRQARKQRSARA
jgi:acyl-lipid omega-6 desaturase (Delta-12 desaturase)